MSEPVEPAGPVDPSDPVEPAPAQGSRPAAPEPTGRSAPNLEAESHGSGFLRGLREIAIVVVTALVISALVRTFLLQAFWVPSGSMEETLMRGDRILVWKPGVDPEPRRRGRVQGPVRLAGRPGARRGHARGPGRGGGLRGDPALDHRRRPRQARDRRGRGHHRVLLARWADHPQRRAPGRALHLPRRPDRPGHLPGRGPRGPAVRDGRPPRRLGGLPLPPRGGRRDRPGGQRRGHGRGHHVADLALGDPAHLRRPAERDAGRRADARWPHDAGADPAGGARDAARGGRDAGVRRRGRRGAPGRSGERRSRRPGPRGRLGARRACATPSC